MFGLVSRKTHQLFVKLNHDLVAQNTRLLRRVDVLNGAIEWALGERGTFANRMQGEGAYWWRKELRARANIGTPRQVKFPPAPIFTRMTGIVIPKGGDQNGQNRQQADLPEEGQG